MVKGKQSLLSSLSLSLSFCACKIYIHTYTEAGQMGAGSQMDRDV